MESTTQFLEEQAAKLQELIENKDRLIETLQKRESDYSQSLTMLEGKVRRVRDYLTENYDELEGHAESIAEILELELTRDITYSVQMNATVTVSVPVGEDGEEILIENLYIDANHGDIVIDDYEVCTVRESY